MNQKWSILRGFLKDIMTKLDNDKLTVEETMYLGYFYDLCHDQSEKDDNEMKRIITLGMVANYALRENNSSK